MFFEGSSANQYVINITRYILQIFFNAKLNARMKPQLAVFNLQGILQNWYVLESIRNAVNGREYLSNDTCPELNTYQKIIVLRDFAPYFYINLLINDGDSWSFWITLFNHFASKQTPIVPSCFSIFLYGLQYWLILLSTL